MVVKIRTTTKPDSWTLDEEQQVLGSGEDWDVLHIVYQGTLLVQYTRSQVTLLYANCKDRRKSRNGHMVRVMQIPNTNG
jgi:hypothetical protein